MYMAYNRGPGIPLFCGCRSHDRYVQGRPLFAAYSYEREYNVQDRSTTYYDSTPYRIAVTQEGPAGPLFRGTRAHPPLRVWRTHEEYLGVKRPLCPLVSAHRVLQSESQVPQARGADPRAPGGRRQGPGRRRLPNCQRGGCVPLFFSSFGLGHTEDRQGWRVPLLEGKGLSWLIGTGTLDAPGALRTHWQ